jgi:hypothetical protein
MSHLLAAARMEYEKLERTLPESEIAMEVSAETVRSSTVAQRPSLTPASTRLLQRKCACGGTGANGECDSCHQESVLQRQANGPSGYDGVPPSLHGVLRSAGDPLDPAARGGFEPGFGHDFSRIPVHPPTAGAIQKRLTVNEPGDEYEQEADRIADQVIATPAHPDVSGAPPIQRFSGQLNGQQRDGASASVDQALASPGRPLEPTLRQDMEHCFGHDFSRVRVHSGALAEQSARNVDAHAYAVGHNIVFGAGRFAPVTQEGRRLIAHELTHVVQQSGSTSPTVQRQVDRKPTQGTDDQQPPLFTLFIADPHKRTDVRFARRQGQADSARIQESGTLSVQDRQLVNAKLRFFKGEAKEAYIQDIGPALREVAPDQPKHEISMPAEYVGSDQGSVSGPKPVQLLSLDYSGPEVCGGRPCVTDAEIYAASEQSRGEDAAAQAKATAERKRRLEIRSHGTTQQKWELDFDIQYSHLKNIGARTGPRDTGIMTDTGVRVPRDPSNFLTPRRFYERKSAAFLAYQGFIHFAEIVESGQDPAANNLALANGGFPIPDDKLDLNGFTHWSRQAVASRKGVEVGLLVANVASAAEDFAAALAKRFPEPVPGAATPLGEDLGPQASPNTPAVKPWTSEEEAALRAQGISDLNQVRRATAAQAAAAKARIRKVIEQKKVVGGAANQPHASIYTDEEIHEHIAEQTTHQGPGSPLNEGDVAEENIRSTKTVRPTEYDPWVEDSKLLGRRLEQAKMPKPGPDYEAHHIVPSNEPAAQQLRVFLRDHGFNDINDVDNGVWLPRGSQAENVNSAYMHDFTFDRPYTREYFERLEDILMKEGITSSEIHLKLRAIREYLKQGKLPPIDL